MVAAVASDEPQIAPKPAQAPTSRHGDAALAMAEPAFAALNSAGHARQRRELPHQQEHRDDRQRVAGKGAVGFGLQLASAIVGRPWRARARRFRTIIIARPIGARRKISTEGPGRTR
jgi:hypothetical protein